MLLFITYLIFCCKKKYGVYLLLASIAIVVAKSFLMAIKVYDDEFSIAFEIVRAVGYLLLAISAVSSFTVLFIATEQARSPRTLQQVAPISQRVLTLI